MNEHWMPVVDFEGIYEVSDQGRVASLPKSNRPSRRILRLGHDTDGYPQVILCRDRQRFTRKVHALVLEAFVGPRPVGMVTRHLNGNPQDNARGNLKWGTSAENAADRVAHGRDPGARLTHGRVCGHPLSGENLYRDPAGSRSCRSCRADALARYRAKRSPKVRRSFKGEMSATAKLTREQAMEIRRRGQTRTERQVDIATEFGVSQGTVSLIVREETWR